jgi:hypothetical protein
MKQVEQDYLETEFIDRYGLPRIIDAMADICHLKAEHIQSNWQDNLLADKWGELASKIEVFNQTICEQAKAIQGLR